MHGCLPLIYISLLLPYYLYVGIITLVEDNYVIPIIHACKTMLCTSNPLKEDVELKSICVEFGPGSYVVNYGFIYALCGGQVC